MTPDRLPSDIHTHHEDRALTAIVNRSPGDPMIPGGHYSVGIHPWDTDSATDRTIAALRLQAADPRILLIGETGIDKARSASIERQIELLRIHAELAEQLHKPLLLHIVHAWPQIIDLHRQMRPTVPWIIHGFRGKPQLARQLLNAGFSISLGLRYNPDVLPVIPPDRLYRETDTL